MNPSKTICSSFHLANRLASRELSVYHENVRIKHESISKYLGVSLDRSLSFRKHLEQTAGKIHARNNLLRNLASHKWGASFNVLRSSSLALCFSVAEYCSPVWTRSASTSLVDTALHSTMRLISGCIKPTPTPQLAILSGIAPPDIRRKELCFKLVERARVDQTHLLHHLTQESNFRTRLKRQHIANHLRDTWKDARGSSPSALSLREWTDQWATQDCRLQQFIRQPTKYPPGCDLPRSAWVQLNRLRTGHGRFKEFMFRIGLSKSNKCGCGNAVQTPDHVLTCRTYNFRGNMAAVDDVFRQWLLNADLSF